MNVLLVEPDGVLGRVYQEALSSCGFVAWARSAEQAVQMADQQTPDVVVLEPKLARHNGVEFLYEFKSYAEWRDVPVVVLTSSNDLKLPERVCRDLSVVCVLRKQEVDLQELCSIVHGMAEKVSK